MTGRLRDRIVLMGTGSIDSGRSFAANLLTIASAIANVDANKQPFCQGKVTKL